MLAELIGKCVRAGASSVLVRIPNGRAGSSRLIEVELRPDGDESAPVSETSKYRRDVAATLVQELEIHSIHDGGDRREYQRGDLDLERLLPGEQLPVTGASFNATLADEGLRILISLVRAAVEGLS